MRKLILASTALTVLWGMGTAQAAEKIKLELGGYSKWWVVGAWQSKNWEQAHPGEDAGTNADVKGDNRIFFGGETTLDNGLKIGATVEIEAGGQNQGNEKDDFVNRSFVFIEGGFGKVILGSEANGAVLLHAMAPDAAGNWAGNNMVFQSLAQPGSVVAPQSTEIDTDDNADKITYVSPSFYGLTVGGSFIPNVLSEDNANFNVGGVPAYGVAALYANSFGPVDVKVSGGYVWYDINGDANPGPGGNSSEWSSGLNLSYAGFTLGGSYRKLNIDHGIAEVISSGHAWDVGLMYANGPYSVSVAYFNSTAQDDPAIDGEDKIELVQASGRYGMGPGVDVVGTIGHIRYKDESGEAGEKNQGWVAMTGLSLAF